MSLVMIACVSMFLLFVFWQFGARISPRYAITWWAGAAFLLVCTVFPSSLGPISQFLGIEVISNFVIGGLILFLFFQSIDLTSDLSKSNRTLRKLISADAADKWLGPQNKSCDSDPRVLIVLPCYNEEAMLGKMIEELKAYTSTRPGFDFLIVNDGSEDRSLSILSQTASDSFTSHKVNIGVAGVLMTGFTCANRFGYQYVVQCDSDGQHPISKIGDLIAIAKENDMDLLVGSRFLSGVRAGSHSTTLARLFGIFFLRCSLRLFGARACITDPTSGFRVYSQNAVRVLLRQMPDEYPEPESVVLLSLAGLKIAEQPVEMYARGAGVSSISGLKQFRYFAKVTTALIGLRLRHLAP